MSRKPLPPGSLQAGPRQFPKMFVNAIYPPNTLLIVDRLVGEAFLIEVQTVAAL